MLISILVELVKEYKMFKEAKRLKREKRAIHDSVYKKLTNPDQHSIANLIIEELGNEEDGNLFATWDNKLDRLT